MNTFFNRLQKIAENEDGADIPDDIDDEDLDDPEPETIKYPNRSGSYSLCVKAGLGGLAKKFGLSPEHFAENLRDNYQRYEVDQDHVEPAETAKQFLSPLVSTWQIFLSLIHRN